jgi:maltose/moltooligosaccharide transporter
MASSNNFVDTPTTANSPKPKMSFWQIFNMSFGFLGIQFGFELQNSNVSRIFETLGANKDDIPILWIAAPLTGLLVQPIIGYLSDRTWHPYWGRRRPYFFIGAILSTLALFVMPNSSTLWIAGGMLWILDASINISMEPFRAFVGDNLNSKQRTSGFAMQSFFIGVGSVIAALLPWVFTNWFNISNTAAAGHIPDSVKYSFYFGGIAFLGAVLYTVFTTKEFPPESLEAFKKEKSETTFKAGLKETFGGILHMPKTMKQLAIVQFFTWFALFAMWIYSTNAVTANKYNMKVDQSLVSVMEQNIKSTLDTLKDKKAIKELSSLQVDIDEVHKYRSNQNPVTISVNLANKFSNEGLVKESIVLGLIKNTLAIEKTTDDATKKLREEFEKREKQVLENDPNKNYITPASFTHFMSLAEKNKLIPDSLKKVMNEIRVLKNVQQEFNNGADWLSVCSSVRNGVAAIFAFIIPIIAFRTNRKITHMICLLVGGLGLISIYFITNPTLIIISMGMVGIAWASILSMPYAMLSNALPPKKMGYFMGVFNFFIVIPQIVAASILGFFTMNVFHANTLNTVVLGGVSMIVAALLTLIVKDADDEE